MKLLKFFFSLCMITVLLSACRLQGTPSVNDIVEGTPSNADTVLPHKFSKHELPGAHHAEKELLPEFKN